MRLRLLMAAGVGALVALVAVALLVATRGTGSASGPVGPTGWAGAVRPPGIGPAAFALRDERGRTVRARDFRGKVLAIMFVYSTCRDTCPLTAQQVRGALDRVRGARALAVSVDPRADTRAHIRTFLREQRLAGRVPYLVGTRARLAGVWRQFGVGPEGQREHDVSVVLLDRGGRQRVGFGVDDLSAEALAHDLAELARKG
jgi:protein SCO1/2